MSNEKKYKSQFELGSIKKQDEYLFDKDEAKVAVDLELNNLLSDYREYVQILEGMIENNNKRIFFDVNYMKGIELFFEAYGDEAGNQDSVFKHAKWEFATICYK